MKGFYTSNFSIPASLVLSCKYKPIHPRVDSRGPNAEIRPTHDQTEPISSFQMLVQRIQEKINMHVKKLPSTYFGSFEQRMEQQDRKGHGQHLGCQWRAVGSRRGRTRSQWQWPLGLRGNGQHSDRHRRAHLGHRQRPAWVRGCAGYR